MYDNHSTSSSEAETIELIDEVDKEVLCEFHKPTPKLFPRLLFRKLERTMVSAGNCEIFRATRRVDGKLVAIKRLNITSVDPLSVTFFENEARMARIVSDCEGVVRTHACYRTRHHIWLVMDWINGSMLKKLAMHMPLHSAHVAYIARHVLSCLLWFHQRGISHRDIKPTNIMVDDDASLFVIDLGYAKIHTKENPIDTEVVGTLVYMAPEVIAGTGHAMTADIWSLGMTVYELLCGHPPYVGCDVTVSHYGPDLRELIDFDTCSDHRSPCQKWRHPSFP